MKDTESLWRGKGCPFVRRVRAVYRDCEGKAEEAGVGRALRLFSQCMYKATEKSTVVVGLKNGIMYNRTQNARKMHKSC